MCECDMVESISWSYVNIVGVNVTGRVVISVMQNNARMVIYTTVRTTLKN